MSMTSEITSTDLTGMSCRGEFYKQKKKKKMKNITIFMYYDYYDISGILNELYAESICMDAVQHGGRHYDTHSLYGHGMSVATYE